MIKMPEVPKNPKNWDTEDVRKLVAYLTSEERELEQLKQMHPKGEFFFTSKTLQEFQEHKPLGRVSRSKLGEWYTPDEMKGRHIQIMSSGHRPMKTLEDQVNHGHVREMIARAQVYAEAKFELPELEVKQHGWTDSDYSNQNEPGFVDDMNINSINWDDGSKKRRRNGDGKNTNLNAYYKGKRHDHHIWIDSKSGHMINHVDGSMFGERIGDKTNLISTRIIAPNENNKKNETRPRSIILNCFCLR